MSLLVFNVIKISKVSADISITNYPSSYNTQYKLTNKFIPLLENFRSGTKSHINVLSIGDSLTAKVSTRLWEDFLSEIFPDSNSVRHPSWNNDSNVENYGLYGNGISCSLNKGSKQWQIKSNYDLNFTGTYFSIEDGESVKVTRTNISVYIANKIIIPYLKTKDSGTFRVTLAEDLNSGGFGARLNYYTPLNSNLELTNGELIVNTESYNTDLGIIEIYLDTPRACSYQVEHISGGSIDFFPPSFFIENNTDIPTINVQHHGRGSNDFINVADASVPLMAKWIDAINPLIITVQSDDSGRSYRNFLPLLHSAISQSATSPFVILIGEGPKQAEDRHNKIIAANSAQAHFSNVYGWYFYNALQLSETFADLDVGHGGDGTHLHGNFYIQVASEIWNELTRPTDFYDWGIAGNADLFEYNLNDSSALHESVSSAFPNHTAVEVFEAILNNPSEIGLYRINEIQNLRLGSTMIEVHNNQVTINLELEQSIDGKIWAKFGNNTSVTLPADESTKFFRFISVD